MEKKKSLKAKCIALRRKLVWLVVVGSGVASKLFISRFEADLRDQSLAFDQTQGWVFQDVGGLSI